MRRAQVGFTLLEVLLVTALLLVILVSLTQFLVSGNNSYRKNAIITSAEDELDLIAQLLNYDFRMAGHQQNDTLSQSDAILGTCGPESEATIIVRYWENRYAENRHKEIEYKLSGGELTRTESGAGTYLLSSERFSGFTANDCATQGLITFTLTYSADKPAANITVPLIALSGGTQ